MEESDKARTKLGATPKVVLNVWVDQFDGHTATQKPQAQSTLPQVVPGLINHWVSLNKAWSKPLFLRGTPLKFNIVAPENGWLMMVGIRSFPFLLGFGLFSGANR